MFAFLCWAAPDVEQPGYPAPLDEPFMEPRDASKLEKGREGQGVSEGRVDRLAQRVEREREQCAERGWGGRPPAYRGSPAPVPRLSVGGA